MGVNFPEKLIDKEWSLCVLSLGAFYHFFFSFSFILTADKVWNFLTFTSCVITCQYLCRLFYYLLKGLNRQPQYWTACLSHSVRGSTWGYGGESVSVEYVADITVKTFPEKEFCVLLANRAIGSE